MLRLSWLYAMGLFLYMGLNTAYGQAADKNKPASRPMYVSLDGRVLQHGNPVADDGNIHQVTVPLLRLLRTKSNPANGTVLLLPGGGYEILRLKNEGKNIAEFLNLQGFDVAILDYHIATGGKKYDSAVADALKAFRLLRKNYTALELSGEHVDMMGFASGGQLAARTVQRLAAGEQPRKLMLVSPENLNETVSGTVIPAIMPPVKPTAELLATFSINDKPEWIKSCSEYAKTWRGYDGQKEYDLLPDSSYLSTTDTNPIDAKLKLPDILTEFLASEFVKSYDSINPAAVPVEGYAGKRHKEKLQLIATKKFDLLMVGNSITNNFEKPEYQPVWNQFFAPRNAVNLGYSGYRTENIIWNIENGELNGQHPKVVVLEIGTNNIDEKNYPTRHTAGQLAGGMEAIVKIMREKLPDSKIIILRCFPGCYGGPNPTSHRAILERASDIVAKLADGKNIFYCDVNHVFLNIDGSINQDRMPDWLHPSPAGAKAWAQAMEPLLSTLMGDKSLDTEIPANTAIVPVSKLEEDSYNWWDRHAEALRIKDSVNPEIVLIGNSITHFWGGLPQLRNADGQSRLPNGPKSWDSLFNRYRVLNLGFGWDRTQNVLWRLDHGELDGLQPKTVVINIGTNNTSQTNNARMNTAQEIVEGIRAVYMRVRSKTPHAKIILMAIFPREKDPMSARRLLINQINIQLESFAKENKITFVDIGPNMLAPDGSFLPGMMLDYTHPTDKGYQVWADGIKPYFEP